MAMEEARRDLQHRLEEVLGKEHALTLMAALPPTEFATKSDIESLREAMRGMETRIDARFEAFEERIDARFEASEARIDARFAIFEERIDARFEASEARINERIDLKVESCENRVIAAFRKELVAQTRVFVFSTLAAVVTVGGLAVTAGRFA